jgi:hypothetical protein
MRYLNTGDDSEAMAYQAQSSNSNTKTAGFNPLIIIGLLFAAYKFLKK